MTIAIDNKNRKFKKFGQFVREFKLLDGSEGKVGIIFEFRFENGLGVSVADHNEISGNPEGDAVSVALTNANTLEIINTSKVLDQVFGLNRGVTGLDRDQVAKFLLKVKLTGILEFVMTDFDCDCDCDCDCSC